MQANGAAPFETGMCLVSCETVRTSAQKVQQKEYCCAVEGRLRLAARLLCSGKRGRDGCGTLGCAAHVAYYKRCLLAKRQENLTAYSLVGSPIAALLGE